MSEDRSTFEATRARLEDIVTQVRRKDVSLEQSLDMLEEAVRLVNQCNELIDQTSFKAPAPAGETAVAPETVAVFSIGAAAVVESDDGEVEVVEVVETFEVSEDGSDSAEGEGETAEGGADSGSSWGSVDAWDEDVSAPVEEMEDDARE